MTSRQVALSVNDEPIPIDYFVQSFIDHVISGMLAALEGTGEIQTLNLAIKKETVEINLNGTKVPINAFVNKIIRNITLGMVSSLKGVSVINRLEIIIKK